jgi:hypothetical protein
VNGFCHGCAIERPTYKGLLSGMRSGLTLCSSIEMHVKCV